MKSMAGETTRLSAHPTSAHTEGDELVESEPRQLAGAGVLAVAACGPCSWLIVCADCGATTWRPAEERRCFSCTEALRDRPPPHPELQSCAREATGPSYAVGDPCEVKLAGIWIPAQVMGVRARRAFTELMLSYAVERNGAQLRARALLDAHSPDLRRLQ